MRDTIMHVFIGIIMGGALTYGLFLYVMHQDMTKWLKEFEDKHKNKPK